MRIVHAQGLAHLRCVVIILGLIPLMPVQMPLKLFRQRLSFIFLRLLHPKFHTVLRCPQHLLVASFGFTDFVEIYDVVGHVIMFGELR